MEQLHISKLLFRKSYPPAPQDVAVATRALTRAKGRLKGVEDEILRLQKLSQSLSQQQAALFTFSTRHRALLSPCHRLPPDILSEIFFHCLPTAHNAIMSIHEPPLLLGYVCHRWREIVYSTPRLWSSLHIVASPTLESHRDTARRGALLAWLSRSGILPLSISIYMDLIVFPSPSRELMNDLFREEIDIIARHASRWRSIDSLMPGLDPDWLGVLANLGSHNLPLLEHLDVGDSICGTRYGPELWADLIPEAQVSRAVTILRQSYGVLQAPSLRSMFLPVELAIQLEPHMQWERLTTLDLRFGSSNHVSQLLQLLSHCLNLLHCKVTVMSPTLSAWDDTLPPPPSVSSSTLKTLRSLSLDAAFLGNGLICQLLRHLSCPGLLHFYYRWHKQYSSTRRLAPSPFDEAELIGALEAFLDKVLGPLVEMSLIFGAIREQTLLKILSCQCVQSVTRLLTSGPIISEFQLPPQRVGSCSYRLSPPIPQSSLSDAFLKYLIPGSDVSWEATSDIQIGDGDGLPASGGSLCPNLELISLPYTSASCNAIMDFLRSRTAFHHQNNVARLRALDISFSDSLDESEVNKACNRLITFARETGLQVFIQHPDLTKSDTDSLPPRSNSFAPYIELPSHQYPNSFSPTF